MRIAAALLIVGFGLPLGASAEPSVARQWMEALLDAIRNDFARPTVHARNLFHVSVAMYDAWAIYDETADPYLLGRSVDGFQCPLTADIGSAVGDIAAARSEAISYAAYRLLRHRFTSSPGAPRTMARLDSLLFAFGYDPDYTSTLYGTGSAAALGNYLAECLIAFGLQDGSGEQREYDYRYYAPVNPPLAPAVPGNPALVDPNRWQPLSLDVYVDQSGHLVAGEAPKFIGPEWGWVTPFALQAPDRTDYSRDGITMPVYHDPGPPSRLGSDNAGYLWGFALVSIWSSHLDPSDGVMWDISPASIGNVIDRPKNVGEYSAFYDLFEGGDSGEGHRVNPRTGRPYEAHVVPRGDYTRVLAEFWADGPASETPPGHWFTILNYVSDHPDLDRRFGGVGGVLDPLEWDVKSYFALGGAMHDAAVAAWSIKGWYDYIRPVSALRAMADRGQCTDPGLPRFDPEGIPLHDGYVEIVQAGDSLAGANGEHVGKVKVYAWRGPTAIEDPRWQTAGAGWILAENWWPYQRPTFVTPPFAGYVSGHSTFSRAAAEVLTLLTGDAYFPGGLGTFRAEKDTFLEFERGPSVDVVLQWATYRDAADQTSLSRIWGGIHPPIDDIPGRRIGEKIGLDAFQLAAQYFGGGVDGPPLQNEAAMHVFPNPVTGDHLSLVWMQPSTHVDIRLFDVAGREAYARRFNDRMHAVVPVDRLSSGTYFVEARGEGWSSRRWIVVVR